MYSLSISNTTILGAGGLKGESSQVHVLILDIIS